MDEVLRVIEIIEDSRQPWKVKHKLLDIVVIVLFAKLANADDWEEIEYFVEYNEDFLKAAPHNSRRTACFNLVPSACPKNLGKATALPQFICTT